LTLDLANNLTLHEIAAGQAKMVLQRMGDVLAEAQQVHTRLHPSLVDARAAWFEVLSRDAQLHGPDDAQTQADKAEMLKLAED
jgi:hypothetical protein